MDDLKPNIDYEPASCPICGNPNCVFPRKCKSAIGWTPERSYPHHDTDEAA